MSTLTLREKLGLMILGILTMALVSGCGTTQVATGNTTSLQTSFPNASYILHTDNSSPSIDTLSSVADLTVEPHSVIKIYDIVDVELPYTTTANDMGRFTLNIGDDALSGTTIFITATAPFKTESQPIAKFIP